MMACPMLVSRNAIRASADGPRPGELWHTSQAPFVSFRKKRLGTPVFVGVRFIEFCGLSGPQAQNFGDFFGLRFIAGGCGASLDSHGGLVPWNFAIPEHLQVALDETPVQYSSKVKKTLTDAAPDARGGSERKQVRVLGADKRMVTGCPVTTRSGRVLLFQFIWKGKTLRCFQGFL